MLLIRALILASLAVAVFAQGMPGTYIGSGVGSVLTPGTPPGQRATLVGPPPTNALGQPGAFAGQFGATIQGRTVPGDKGRPRQRVYAVPYAYPVLVGGWDTGAAQAPTQVNVNVVTPPPQSPTVVINQYYTPESANPSLREYPEGSLPEPAQQSTLKSYEAPAAKPLPDPADNKPVERVTMYLIAFKNGTIYPALAFWTEGDTLHYVTRDKSINKASIELIDRDLSVQLNRERQVDFVLQPEK